MLASKLVRIILLPFGLLAKLYELSVVGARDIHNKLRFRKAIIDRNCCIDPTSVIEANTHILENSYIWDSTIQSFSYIGRNSIIQHTRIGSYCSLANDVFIGLGAHPVEHFSTSPLFYRVANTFRFKLIDEDYEFSEYKPVEIGNDVWVGARAIILDGIKIGNGAIIAANAVVTRDVPPYAIVGGTPAKIMRYRFSAEKIERLLELSWWSWPLSEIRGRIKELNKL